MSDVHGTTPRRSAPARALGLARRATIALAVAALVYTWWRFESFRFPEDRCSPVQRIAAGVRLWIDTRPPAYHRGDLVFFTGARGEVLFGELEELRDEEAWITTDVPECPGVDSDVLGWIPLERLAGRVLLATRW